VLSIYKTIAYCVADQCCRVTTSLKCLPTGSWFSKYSRSAAWLITATARHARTGSVLEHIRRPIRKVQWHCGIGRFHRRSVRGEPPCLFTILSEK
jgi:hypothetical protein